MACSCRSVLPLMLSAGSIPDKKEIIFSYMPCRGWERKAMTFCSTIPPPEVRDEEWERQRREESKDLVRRRQVAQEEEKKQTMDYREIGLHLKNYPIEEVKKAKRLVTSFIRAGEAIEEKIEEAADDGELTPLVLLVIKNRLELAQHDDERHVIQALDLLYRRIETEILKRESSLGLQLLHELLNLHDGFDHDDWLQRCRRVMLKVFPPESAFTILAPPGTDLSKQKGPLPIPEKDNILLRIDFIREIDKLILEVEYEFQDQVMHGMDPQSVAIRLKQEEKRRTLQYVKDLRHLAATLKW